MPHALNIELAVNTDYLSIGLRVFNDLHEEGIAIELRWQYWQVMFSQGQGGVTFLFGPIGFHLWNMDKGK